MLHMIIHIYPYNVYKIPYYYNMARNKNYNNILRSRFLFLKI